MDEYKHSEKRALCTSCHDYTNVRAPLLRGNSYQEDPIAEEDHQTGNDPGTVNETTNVTTNEIVAEVHNSSTSHSNSSETQCNSSQTNCNFDNNEIRRRVSCNCEKDKCSCESLERRDSKCNNDNQLNQTQETKGHQVLPVSIELSEDLREVVSETKTEVDNDLKQISEVTQEDLGLDLQLKCNGKHRDAFIIETKFKENSEYVPKDKEEETELGQNKLHGASNENIANINTCITKSVETKVNKVHELAHMFEHVEDLHKIAKNDEDHEINIENQHLNTSKDQEDLDNSFEREFKDSCKEIINSARNSLVKNVCEDFQLNKDSEPLKRFDSESTLQLSDVETESCHQYDVSSYVNINTCRTTNL